MTLFPPTSSHTTSFEYHDGGFLYALHALAWPLRYASRSTPGQKHWIYVWALASSFVRPGLVQETIAARRVTMRATLVVISTIGLHLAHNWHSLHQYCSAPHVYSLLFASGCFSVHCSIYSLHCSRTFMFLCFINPLHHSLTPH